MRILLLLFILVFIFHKKACCQNASYGMYNLGNEWYLQEPFGEKIYYAGLDTPPNITWKNFIVPSVFVSYGFLALKWKPLINFNLKVKETIAHRPHNSPFKIDDFLQYGPIAMLAVLRVAGIKGNNNVFQKTTLLAASTAIQGIVVTSIKTISNVKRPDHSSHNSFPSGHTTTAFAGAEMLRLEYGKTSPWIAVTGYLMAGATGFFRMYNNRHWFNDVIAGAGFGIASTDLAYLLNHKVFWRKSKKQSMSVFPMFTQNGFNIGLVKVF